MKVLKCFRVFLFEILPDEIFLSGTFLHDSDNTRGENSKSWDVLGKDTDSSSHSGNINLDNVLVGSVELLEDYFRYQKNELFDKYLEY